MRNGLEIFQATNVYYIVYYFDIVSSRFRKQGTVHKSLNDFNTNMRLPQGLPPDTELLQY